MGHMQAKAGKMEFEKQTGSVGMCTAHAKYAAHGGITTSLGVGNSRILMALRDDGSSSHGG